MAIWAIADLHLSFDTPDKEMHIFGEEWRHHPAKIEEHWRASVSDDDLVLLPGDISWAMHLDQAMADLEWIDKLPGTKVMIKGNHDYWWSSLKKMQPRMPRSIHLIQNNSFCWGEYVIAGSRLWDCRDYFFDNIIRQSTIKAQARPFILQPEKDKLTAETEKVFQRELHRLEISLKTMPSSKKRLVMTHYPPIGVKLDQSRVAMLLEDYAVEACVFGHLHGVVHDFDPLFGTRRGVRYLFVAADYLDFAPQLVCSVP